jgi:hypothetical protein
MAGFLPVGPFDVHLYFRAGNPGAIRSVFCILSALTVALCPSEACTYS